MHAAFSFSQSPRLLCVSFASGIAPSLLLAQQLSGQEGISTGFTYSLSCLSPDAYLELKQFIGVPAQIAMLTDDGQLDFIS